MIVLLIATVDQTVCNPAIYGQYASGFAAKTIWSLPLHYNANTVNYICSWMFGLPYESAAGPPDYT